MSETVDPYIKWFVEVLHYPFDVSFKAPPPVDHRALAAHWNAWDGWEISDEDAYLSVCSEAGIKPEASDG